MDKLSLILKYLAGFFLLGLLAFFAYLGKVSSDVLVVTLTSTLGLVTGHTIGKGSGDVTNVINTTDKQGGFVRLPLLLLGSLFACVFFLSGCATTSAITGKTPAQIQADIQTAGAKFCAVARPTLVTLQALSLAPDAAASVATAKTVVTTVCVAGAVIAKSDLVAAANTALPALIAAIKASPLSDDDKNTAIVGASVANVAINTAIAQ